MKQHPKHPRTRLHSRTAQPRTPRQQTPTRNQPEDKTDWKAEARKWEQRAKENGAAAKELEKQRQGVDDGSRARRR